MRLWDRLKSALAGTGRSGDSDRGGLYLYVRCARCHDVVRVRINMANDLQQEFAEGEGVSGYSLRKGVVDVKCFRPIEVNMSFDNRRRELSRGIEGGEFITREEFEEARAQAGGGQP